MELKHTYMNGRDKLYLLPDDGKVPRGVFSLTVGM